LGASVKGEEDPESVKSEDDPGSVKNEDDRESVGSVLCLTRIPKKDGSSDAEGELWSMVTPEEGCD